MPKSTDRPPPPGVPGPFSAAKPGSPRFFCVFCGGKKGAPTTDKLAPHTEKSNFAPKPELILVNRIYTPIMELANSLRHTPIDAVGGLSRPARHCRRTFRSTSSRQNFRTLPNFTTRQLRATRRTLAKSLPAADETAADEHRLVSLAAARKAPILATRQSHHRRAVAFGFAESQTADVRQNENHC